MDEVAVVCNMNACATRSIANRCCVEYPTIDELLCVVQAILFLDVLRVEHLACLGTAGIIAETDLRRHSLTDDRPVTEHRSDSIV
jgi:hypothetical protein